MVAKIRIVTMGQTLSDVGLNFFVDALRQVTVSREASCVGWGTEMNLGLHK